MASNNRRLEEHNAASVSATRVHRSYIIGYLDMLDACLLCPSSYTGQEWFRYLLRQVSALQTRPEQRQMTALTTKHQGLGRSTAHLCLFWRKAVPL
jgi:hypothetical protein